MQPHITRSISRVALALVLVGTALGCLSVGTASPATAKTPDKQDSEQTFARDVFVIIGSSLRNPEADTPASAPLFNDAGVALGLTWGAWQSASAAAIARSTGSGQHGHTDVELHLTGLIPGGIYSLFYGTLSPDTENPLCPGVERTLPLISRDHHQQPDAASFVADAVGNASFRGRIDGDPFAALQFFYTVIYHLNGKTYGSLPNAGEFLTQGPGCHSSFGEDAMRQLIIFQKFQ